MISKPTQHFYLNLIQPRFGGDERFFKRWDEVGAETRNPKQVTILIVDFNQLIDNHALELYPNVKYVVSPTTGHTHLTADFEARAVQLVTLRGETHFLKNIYSTAEHTIYLMMRLAKEIPPHQLLRNKLLGIVGYGRVGHQVDQLAEGLGVRVTTVDKRSSDANWNFLFSESDFISIHVDENPTSRKLISSDLLAVMKPTAFLVNTSRPSVIDESALYKAVSDGRIAGCALDVTDIDWPKDAKRVILTDHVAGSSFEDRIRVADFCLAKLKSTIKAEESRSLPTTP